MLHDELIERRGRRHQHSARSPAAPPGAARALPRGRDRSGISRHHARIERADVDAQLQRIRRDHAANAAFAQAALDLAPLARQIAAAIAANRLGLPRLRAIRLLQIREQHLGVQPAIGEHDRLQLARKKFLGHARRLVQIAAANPQVAVHHRRIVENEKLFGGRGAVFFDHLDLFLDQLLRQLARIRNRRRAADELRIGAVKARHAPKPPQHVRQMAAEHAAIGVQFIQHDVAQIFEQPHPVRVVRQNAACAACPGWRGSRGRARGWPCARRSACRRRR